MLGCAVGLVIGLILMLVFPNQAEPTFIAGEPVPVLIPFPVPVEVPVVYPARIDANEQLGAFSDPDGQFYCFPVEGAGF